MTARGRIRGNESHGRQEAGGWLRAAASSEDVGCLSGRRDLVVPSGAHSGRNLFGDGRDPSFGVEAADLMVEEWIGMRDDASWQFQMNTSSVAQFALVALSGRGRLRKHRSGRWGRSDRVGGCRAKRHGFSSGAECSSQET